MREILFVFIKDELKESYFHKIGEVLGGRALSISHNTLQLHQNALPISCYMAIVISTYRHQDCLGFG